MTFRAFHYQITLKIDNTARVEPTPITNLAMVLDKGIKNIEPAIKASPVWYISQPLKKVIILTRISLIIAYIV